MYNYTTTTYLGYKIHIITAKTDSSENVQLSVMANHYSSTAKALAINFHDTSLEDAGWVRRGIINGGLFFTENNIHYANGIERAYGITNENDDSSLNTVMAFAHSGNTSNAVVLNTQINIAASLDSYRGAITGAFGLLRNGSIDQGATNLQGNYSSESGRSIIGNKEDGTIYFISVAGVTGSSGLTGAECLSFVQSLGLYNAIAMDGGGSVSLISDDDWKIPTVTTNARLIKNTVAIYTKAIVPTPTPITPPASTAELPAPKKGTTAVNRMYFGANKVKKIMRIDPSNQAQIVAYRDTIVSTNFPQEFGTTYDVYYNSNTYNTINHPYLQKVVLNSHLGDNVNQYPFTAALGATSGDARADYSILPWTWTFYLKDCRAAVQGFTLNGWGRNDFPYNTPKSFRIEGSIDNTNWVTLYDTTNFPSTWTGDSMQWGISGSYSYATQKVDGADPALGWGPNGVITVPAAETSSSYKPSGRTVPAMQNTQYYFTYLKVTWRSNQDDNGSNADARKYWTAGYTGYSWKKADALTVNEFSFNVKIQPL